MHVLLITQYFWPEHFRVNDLAAGLVKRGHRVTVATGIPNYPEGRFFEGYGLFRRPSRTHRGCRVIRLPLVPRGKSRPFELALNYLSFAAVAALLLPWIAGRSFDVILVCQLSPATVGIPAVLLKRLTKRPMILWVLDLWPESLSATGAVRSPLVLRMVGRMVSAMYRSSEVVLASSKGFIPAIEQRGGPAGHIHYFPNWVEDTDAAEQRVRSAAGLEAHVGDFRVLFAGNIGRAQSFETIVDAAERLRQESRIQWLIAGDGRRRDWVERQVRDRGLQKTVHLLGSYPAAAMPALFSEVDALLVTLGSDALFSLTAPGKLQSYLAAGKLIIGSLQGEGYRVLEDSGAALLCPPEDPRALAEAVMAAYKLPTAIRTAMGQSGRRYCSEYFGREALMDRFEMWMREAVESFRVDRC